MIKEIINWKGPVEINGTFYEHVSAIPSDLKATDNMVIILKTTVDSSVSQAPKSASEIFKVTVRQYMTKPSTPDFDFMVRWNNNIPMPLRTMVGEKIKETPGMVYMKLHGDITEEQTECCMKCGRPITNAVSKYFGMGPECGGHNYINPFNSKEELDAAVSNYKKQLQDIIWEGWIIKSAITNIENLGGN